MNFVEEKLNEWRLQELIPVFEESDVTEERACEMTAWLKQNKEPSAQVTSFIASTAASRAKLVKEDETMSFGGLAKLYPRLVDMKGMIEQDFRLQCPDNADKFCEMWQEPVATRLLGFVEKSRPDWKSLLKVDSGELVGESKLNVALQALPLTFGVPSYKEKTKTVRLSYSAALKKFINTKPNGTNIPEYFKETPMYPHVLILGNDATVKEYFIVVEGMAIKRDTPIKAVDTCFKLFYVADLAYPACCVLPWQVLQTICFDLNQQNVYPAVRALRNVLLAN